MAEAFRENARFQHPLFKAIGGDVVEAAKSLIGALLTRIIDKRRFFCVRIVETEAYHQSEPGSHSYNGPTPRSQIMFGKPGFAYVYLIYGMYHCLNVVSGREGEGAAVLIRAAEPIAAKESIFGNAEGSNSQSLPDLSGPGKLCRALGISRLHNGVDLLDVKNGQLWLEETRSIPGEISVSQRIGLSKGAALPWRFFEEGNPNVSGGARYVR